MPFALFLHAGRHGGWMIFPHVFLAVFGTGEGHEKGWKNSVLMSSSKHEKSIMGNQCEAPFQGDRRDISI